MELFSVLKIILKESSDSKVFTYHCWKARVAKSDKFKSNARNSARQEVHRRPLETAFGKLEISEVTDT